MTYWNLEGTSKFCLQRAFPTPRASDKRELFRTQYGKAGRMLVPVASVGATFV